LLLPARHTIGPPGAKAASALAIVYSKIWLEQTAIVSTSAYPNWPWMQLPQLQAPPVPWLMSSGAGSVQSQVPWMMPTTPGTMPYPGVCLPPPAHFEVPAGRTGNVDSTARAARRQKRKLHNDVATKKSSVGRKFRQIRVQPRGEID
jgi:hypothetical protein